MIIDKRHSFLLNGDALVIFPETLLEVFKAEKIQIECDGAELMLLIASLEMVAGSISDAENLYELRVRLEAQATALLKRSICASATTSHLRLELFDPRL